MYKHLALFFCHLLILMSYPTIVNASQTVGSVSSYKYAWGESIAWVNFGVATGNLRVTDSSITGYAWTMNYGWINMAPSTGGVLNDGTGNLSGYAWGESLGWVDFDEVSIGSNGYFTGYATTDNHGRISMTCENDDACSSSNFKVRTDWRPASVRANFVPVVASMEPSQVVETQISKSGGAVQLNESSKVVALNFPSNFASFEGDVNINLKTYDASPVLASIGSPSSVESVNDFVVDASITQNGTDFITDFDSPVILSFVYGDDEVEGIDESTITIHHYHNNIWEELTNCEVDTSINFVTCTSDSFSIFAVFGEGLASDSNESSSSGSGKGGSSDNTIKNFFNWFFSDDEVEDNSNLAPEQDLGQPIEILDEINFFETSTSSIKDRIEASIIDCPVKTFYQLNYSDVEGHWAEKYIDVLNYFGIVKGKTDEIFDPDSAITRAEFTKMIMNSFHLLKSCQINAKLNFSRQVFQDTTPEKWYFPYIAYAHSLTLVGGYADGNFYPNKFIKREEATKLLYQAAALDNYNASEKNTIHPFDDVLPAQWYTEYIQKLYLLGIIRGREVRKFGLNQNLTRAEAAKIIVKALELQMSF